MLRLYVDTVINRGAPDKQDEAARWLQNIKEKGTPDTVIRLLWYWCGGKRCKYEIYGM